MLHGVLVRTNQDHLLDNRRDPHLDEYVQVHPVEPQVVDQEPVELDRYHHEDDVREALLNVAEGDDLNSHPVEEHEAHSEQRHVEQDNHTVLK